MPKRPKMPKKPKIPDVSLPSVNLPSVSIPPINIPGTQNNATSYSMDNSQLQETRESLAGFDDEQQAEERAHLNQARHDRTWEEKEKEESFSLEEDTYSLLYLCDYISVTFAVSMGVFLLQLFILILILTDLMRDVPTYPEVVFFPLDPPIDVPEQVRVAQFLSLLIAILKEEDVFYSLKALVIVGHDERVSVRFPGATPLKWWLSNLMRFVTGFGNIMVSFYFIMGADTVLDIFESFAALEFVSYIDNIVFRLAHWGYMGKPLQRMTIKLESVTLENRREKGRWWIALAAAFICFALVPMITFWAKVSGAQKSGFYLEQAISSSVVVLFGDEDYALPPTKFALEDSTRNLTSFNQDFPPELQYAYFSGSYKVAHYPDTGKLYRHNGRPIYFERNDTLCIGEPTCGMFYYCEELGTWVYTIRGLGEPALKEMDKCEWGWLAQSEQTEKYGLEELNDKTWKVYTGVMTETTVTIKSDSCNLNSDCSLNGECVDGTCICEEDENGVGWQGRYCDERKPYCPALVYVNYGQSSYEYDLVEAFEIARNTDGSALKVYERPVYYREYAVSPDRCGSEMLYELYMYSGRRWYLSYWCEEDLVRYVVNETLVMEESLHAFWDNTLSRDLKMFSELTDSYTGIGLEMYGVRESESLGSKGKYGFTTELEGTLECLDAPCEKDPSICGRYGSCAAFTFESSVETNVTHDWHRCSCRDYYGGLYCQFSPHEVYTREHFQQFLEDPSASQTPYQEMYWDPWLKASGGNPNGTSSASVDVGETGEIATATQQPTPPPTTAAVTNTLPPTTAPPITLSPTTGSPSTISPQGNNASTGNIFSNQSQTRT